jgi:uncharacterized protein (DUF2126 family)
VTFGHDMHITRIYESPRVTKPYTDDQWQAMLALGDAVDEQLVAGDVRLTMGGEPTFVSVDDRDGAEWNTDALGPTKRMYAQDPVHRLRDEYGQGGFLHFGQGKWYPGEQLPRCALSIYWRADGQPCWHDPSLFADERDPHAYTSADAQRFIHRLSAKLGLTDEYIQTGYEDTFYYLWRERRLPVNVDPFDSKLDDEMERIRLRRIFTQGLDHPVGYVLPLKKDGQPGLAGASWVTGPWFFRDERMYLFPGDSPMGYRLPLDSMPWVSKGEFPYLIEQDPFSPRAALPSSAILRSQYAPHAVGGGFAEGGVVAVQHPEVLDLPGTAEAAASLASAATGKGPSRPLTAAELARHPNRFESAHWITRTALCVEVRDPRRANGPKAEAVGQATGVMYVFMPPLAHVEDYLELLAAIESTAAELGVKKIGRAHV